MVSTMSWLGVFANGLLPSQRKAIVRTHADLLSIWQPSLNGLKIYATEYDKATIYIAFQGI